MNLMMKWLRVRTYQFSTIKHNYYKLLELKQDATSQQIKKSYFNLAKKYHPDKNQQNIEKFKQILEAYNTLKDPTKKREYDSRYFNKSSTASSNNSSGYQYKYYKYNFRDQSKYKHSDQYINRQNINNPFKHEGTNYFYSPFENGKNEHFQKGVMKSYGKNRVHQSIMVILFVFWIIITVQIVLHIYAFNAVYKKRTKAEVLDRRQLQRNVNIL